MVSMFSHFGGVEPPRAQQPTVEIRAPGTRRQAASRSDTSDRENILDVTGLEKSGPGLIMTESASPFSTARNESLNSASFLPSTCHPHARRPRPLASVPIVSGHRLRSIDGITTGGQGLASGASVGPNDRCYLGVHYPGDVIAGWVLALAAHVFDVAGPLYIAQMG